MHHKPVLVMIYMQGCSACDEVKPIFQAFAAKHPQLAYGMMDIDRAKVPFPVEYTPTMALKLPGGIYKIDPVALGKDFSEAALSAWVQSCVRDYKARGH